MKALVVEDDFTSRLYLQELLKKYGAANAALNGREGVDAVRAALEAGEPYDLITLDIMMPEMDGQTALQEIRRVEEAAGISSLDGAKVIMTTALGDSTNILTSFKGQCDVYLTKPVDKSKLLESIKKFGLIP